MSIINITEHNENIYNVISRPRVIVKKPPIHMSQFAKAVLEEYKRSKKARGKDLTMGPAEYKPNDPHNFLKKHSVKKMPEKPLNKETSPHQLSVPLHNNWVKKTTKPANFIKQNILYAKKLKPIEPVPRIVYTRTGSSCLLDTSGQRPQDGSRSTIPKYMMRLMETKMIESKRQKDLELIRHLPKCRYMTRQERQDLLNGLKKNWEQMQKEFQLLPMITDTIPKVLKKVKLEKQLQELEKDIRLIEKHQYIYLDEIFDAPEEQPIN